MSTVVIGAEGVLLVPHWDLYGSSRPIVEGLELTQQLKGFPTTRMVVMMHTKRLDVAEFWCKVNGLADAQPVIPQIADLATGPDVAQVHGVQRQRSRGPVSLIVTAFPTVFDACRAIGQPSILFARQGFSEAPLQLKGWDEMMDQVNEKVVADAEEAGQRAERRE
jgi:hypothetical protein